MQKVTRIGVLSLAKLMGGIGVGIGLLIGAIATTVSLLIGVSWLAGGGDSSGFEGFMTLLFGVGSLIMLPILYGAFMFLQGLLVACVANLAFRFFGGLEIELS